VAEIGDKLRDARVRQGKDLDDVEQATKIRTKYLAALEDERFDVLPGSSYAIPFLRTYAEHLGLDARMLVEEYRSRHGQAEADESGPFAAQPVGQQGERLPRDRRTPRGSGGRGPVVAIAVVAILGLLLVLGLTGESGDEGARPPGEDQAAQRGEASAKEARERRRAARRRRERRAADGRVNLRVSPTEPTFVCVDQGAGRPPVYDGILTEGRTFKGKRVRLNLGKTSARVTANGRRVRTGTGVQAVGFSFSPGGKARPLPLGERPCA
jgi:hypothetical protein